MYLKRHKIDFKSKLVIKKYEMIKLKYINFYINVNRIMQMKIFNLLDHLGLNIKNSVDLKHLFKLK